MAKTTNPMTDMTFHEVYGEIPVHMLRMINRMNITPAEFYMLEYQFDKDWQGMRDFINNNRNDDGDFRYPMGGMS